MPFCQRSRLRPSPCQPLSCGPLWTSQASFSSLSHLPFEKSRQPRPARPASFRATGGRSTTRPLDIRYFCPAFLHAPTDGLRRARSPALQPANAHTTTLMPHPASRTYRALPRTTSGTYVSRFHRWIRASFPLPAAKRARSGFPPLLTNDGAFRLISVTVKFFHACRLFPRAALI